MKKEEFFNLKEDCTIIYLGSLAELSYVDGELMAMTLDGITLYYSKELSNGSSAYFRKWFFNKKLCFKLFYKHCSIYVKSPL